MSKEGIIYSDSNPESNLCPCGTKLLKYQIKYCSHKCRAHYETKPQSKHHPWKTWKGNPDDAK